VFRCLAVLCGMAVCGLQTAPASAQDWGRKLFKKTSHDFGVVAHGAKAEYTFEMQNVFKEDIHIAAVRNSCNCATPRIVKHTLKSLETGGIHVTYNTGAFTGRKSSTITVVIDRPYYAEVQLNVTGFIRQDVVFNPGLISFGTVDQGKPAETVIDVDYAGSDQWQIVDVRSAHQHLEVELNQTRRGGGRVGYRMLVRLKGTCPPGYINDHITIVTNDQQSRTLPVQVEGRVVSAVEATQAITMGVLAPGQESVQQIVVKGAKAPFKIVSVECDDDSFQAKSPTTEFQLPTAAKKFHFVPITFKAPNTPGKIAKEIRITTDTGVTLTTIATATVTAASGE